jgi:molybdopterin/thiamine biosynthesis adenylyltransferase
VAQASVVVDARHNFPERYLLNRESVRAGKPLIVSAMHGDAMEAVKVTAGYAVASTGKLIHLDMWDMTFHAFPTARDPRCPDCGSLAAEGSDAA